MIDIDGYRVDLYTFGGMSATPIPKEWVAVFPLTYEPANRREIEVSLLLDDQSVAIRVHGSWWRVIDGRVRAVIIFQTSSATVCF